MSHIREFGQALWFSAAMLAGVAALLVVPLSIRPAEAQSTGCSWQIIASPNTVYPFENVLEAVIALSPTDAWAVGSGNSQIMIQHWDGRDWTMFPTPSIPGASQSKLLAIDAAAPDDIWAVGYYIDVITSWEPLAVHFDGDRWSIVDIPSNLGTFNAPDIKALSSVTVISSNDAWAVGGDARSFHFKLSEAGLLLHWVGVEWRPAFPPVGTGFGNSLEGVTSAATDQVMAVGPTLPWSYSWDGSRWTLEDTLLGNNFVAISAADAQNIMAVGAQPRQTGESPLDGRAISRLFDGTDWSSSSANSSQPKRLNIGGDQGFKAVSALAPDEIWAVGFAPGVTMAQRWDGLEWQIVPSENGYSQSVLNGVDALSASDGWAVGSYRGPNGEQKTLIERYVCDGGDTMHVGDLDGSASSGFFWRARVTITVHDAQQNPVQGAVVSGSWSRGFSGSSSCMTNDSGRCTVVRYMFLGSTVTYTVNNVVGSLMYEPGDNHGDLTSITIDRP